MSDSQEYEALLVRNLPFLRRFAAKLCLRHGFDEDEVKEFVSWATARLVEDDYAILRKFQGKSLITTYLTVVIGHLYGDYQNAEMGRWRPSAEAQRQGDDAIALEELVYRDQHPVATAVAMVLSRGRTQRSERELFALFKLLPIRHRGRLRRVGRDESLESAPARDTAEDPLLRAEADLERSRVQNELKHVLASLSDEEKVIVQLHFFKGMSIAAIARQLQLEQKPLYRRLERILSRLRNDLVRAGVSPERVAAMLAEVRNDS